MIILLVSYLHIYYIFIIDLTYDIITLSQFFLHGITIGGRSYPKDRNLPIIILSLRSYFIAWGRTLPTRRWLGSYGLKHTLKIRVNNIIWIHKL